MASHVVVIDSTARRATVKVTPQTYLSDVLAEACRKLGYRSELYGLKYNKKAVDLSLTYRLANLPAGAQLDLIQSSKSPSVVNVALQFPEAENNVRLTEKFPSTTTLWQVLRRFESGTAGGAPHPLNITQRGIAERNTGAYGAGRMFYEMPALSLMNREFATFVDLQKTLAGVGVTSGSAMFRLNFKHSGKPLEDAMKEISEYFKEEEQPAASSSSSSGQPAPATAALAEVKTAAASEPEQPTAPQTDGAPAQADIMEDVQEAPTTVSEETARPDTTAPSTSQPRIKAFLAPDDNAASAAQIQHNDEDYHPTIDHAKIHQARLEHHGKNTRLLSDAELETQRQEREAKISGVQTIKVRFRFPDQTQIETSYTREHTAQTLFETMAEVLRYPEEKYVLSYREGAKVVNIKRGEGKKLITGLGWTVSTLVYVTWALEGVDEKVKKEPTLKDEFLASATRLQVEHPKEEEEEPEKKGGFLGGLLGGGSKDKGKSKLTNEEKQAKLGRMLGLGKKK